MDATAKDAAYKFLSSAIMDAFDKHYNDADLTNAFDVEICRSQMKDILTHLDILAMRMPRLLELKKELTDNLDGVTLQRIKCA